MISYCPKCGKPNHYSDIKPNFCGFCQESLGVATIDLNITATSRPRRSRSDDDRSLARRHRRPEPVAEPEYDDEYDDEEEDDYYESEPQPRHRATARRKPLDQIKIELMPTEKEEMHRERVDMAKVFSDGAATAQHSSELAVDRAPQNTYTGGDKKNFLRNVLGKSFISSRSNPVEISEYS